MSSFHVLADAGYHQWNSYEKSAYSIASEAYKIDWGFTENTAQYTENTARSDKDPCYFYTQLLSLCD